jgi:putative hemolysin
LHFFRSIVTAHSRQPVHTVGVITDKRHKVPLRLEAASAPVAEVSYPTFRSPAPAAKPRLHAQVGRYALSVAETPEQRDAACRLRFRVFNIELGEGLESSYRTGLDRDRFDDCCEHLLVEDSLESNPARRIVGTYRMQSGVTAARNFGYYSEQEFDFAPYEPLRSGILELGRACIDREHRTPEVLTLLWRGIAQYANNMGLRYLVGCSSINSQDPVEGLEMYRQLENYRVPPEFETEPTAAFACPIEPQGAHTQPPPGPSDQSLPESSPSSPDGSQRKVPKLLRTYLAIGARIAGPPAWDRDFGTIDFLTLLDLKLLSPSARNRFLAPLTR